jgi:ribosome maturation factor RimP
MDQTREQGTEPRLVREQGLEARVARIAEPVVEGLGFRLVRVRISGRDGLTVQVMAERPADGMIDVEECAEISRELSPALDVADPVERAYHLEVSSPGIDRPLVRQSDFQRALGHEVKIEMAVLVDGRRRFRGPILGVENGAAVIGIEGENGTERVALAIEDMAEARLVLTDALIRESLRAQKKAEKAAQAAAKTADGAGNSDNPNGKA